MKYPARERARSAAPGPGEGRRGLRHLRELLEMIGVRVVPDQLAVVKAFQALDAEGHLIRPEDAAQLQRVAAEPAAAAKDQASLAA